jgi:TetR/AcrR family transcriptional regulator, ethionamide resistance regulator
MAAAGLSRTAFYRHFEDRDQLLLALLEHAGLQLQDSGAAWKRGEGEPVAALRAGLAELTAAMVEHGRLIQAIVDASGHDPDLRAQYDELVDGIAAVTAERIRHETAAGRAAVGDPDEIATALVRMSEGYLLTAFGRAVHPDAGRVTRALADVWCAAIYGREA